MHSPRPYAFNRVESNVRFKLTPVPPPLGGHWLTYELAIAALNEFRRLVFEWGAIEIPYFTILSDMEEKAVLEVGFFRLTD